MREILHVTPRIGLSLVQGALAPSTRNRSSMMPCTGLFAKGGPCNDYPVAIKKYCKVTVLGAMLQCPVVRLLLL